LAAQVPEARIASASGRVVLLHGGPGSPAFTLERGTVLNPGDQVDTRGGGRAVIEMSDGSIVTVQPESLIVMKDYRSASGLRELFDITLGRVRVKINHVGGKPNPYRMNSPTASIAVRGTEFAIAVAASGETQVVVYEGAVEVASLASPERKVLIEAGRAVLIASGQDFHLMSPPLAADRDAGDHGENKSVQAGHAGGPPPGQPSGQPMPHPDRDSYSPRATAGTYEQYISGLSAIGQVPFLLRFNAFAEPHLDSLENPAYATTFTRAEGRLFLLPSSSGDDHEANAAFGPVSSEPLTYGMSSQVTFFTPLAGTPVVVGGGVTASQLGNKVQQSSADFDLGVLGSEVNAGDLRISGKSSSDYISASAIAARKLGGGVSVGMEVEKLAGKGTLNSTTVDPDGPVSTEVIDSRSNISQTRMTLGFSKDLTANHKLGVFYRYALLDARDGDVSHTIDGVAVSQLDSTHSWGHSSELGMRLRGSLTPRLFYGVEVSWLSLSLEDTLKRSFALDSHQGDGASRKTAGLGLGYALGRRSVLSFDLTGGTSNTGIARNESANGLLVQTGSASDRFIGLHGSIQTDVTKHLFLSASLLTVWQNHSQTYHLFPDSRGAFTPIGTALFPLSPVAYQPVGHYSDYGAGWRFSRNVFLQYVCSTDYGYTEPSHTLMLRYTFHPKGE
jgi:hypothetical protein